MDNFETALGTAPPVFRPLRFDVLTIFPAMLESLFAEGVVGRALKTGRALVHATDLRAFTTDRHRTVDDRPFGGGEGMVLKPEPIFAAARALGIAARPERDLARETVILLSAQGERFTQSMAQQLSTFDRIALVCGRYEGVDERVTEHLCDREISIGDYVLSGGELPAAVLIDSVVRLLPGVLGNADSSHYESFGASGPSPAGDLGAPLAVAASGGLLDYPHYTRPASFEGIDIPDVLGGGDHRAIREWRRQRALAKTLRNRPDLLQWATLSEEDRRILAHLRAAIAA